MFDDKIDHFDLHSTGRKHPAVIEWNFPLHLSLGSRIATFDT